MHVAGAPQRAGTAGLRNGVWGYGSRAGQRQPGSWDRATLRGAREGRRVVDTMDSRRGGVGEGKRKMCVWLVIWKSTACMRDSDAAGQTEELQRQVGLGE